MNKKILHLAIPNIISNLSVPLLTSVDTALMGRMESEIYIGAIALGGLIFNFIYWSFGFLRMGSTGLTAQAYGEQNDAKLMQILGRALVFGFASGLILLLFQQPISAIGFRLINGSAGVEALAQEYFSVRIWAAPATLCLYGLMGWFFGMQNAIVPMLLTILINIVNIAANLVFVYYFDMKATGVAMGTVIAQYVGLIVALVIFMRKHGHLLLYFKRKAMFEVEAFKQFLRLNGDIFIRTFLLVFSFAFFENQSAIQGDLTLAVNSVLLQFTAWISYGIDGFAYASESLVGRYTGAKDKSNLRKAINLSFFWAYVMACGYSIVFYFFDEVLLGLFTNQTHVIAFAKLHTEWIVLYPLIATAAFIWDGIFVGMTASKAMRNTMAVATVAYLLFYYAADFTLNAMSNYWLWLTFSSFIAFRGIIQTIYYQRYLRQ